MSQALYDRYKDALRRGHVAALRERFGEAIEAYEEAARLAPERALPHASLGNVFRRLGRLDAALAAYDQGLGRAPADAGALTGRADVLVALGRRVDAAETLVRLAEAHEAEGRLTDACDAARRALELAESRTQRRVVERLVGQLRASAADSAAVEAMERALRILEPAGEAGSAPVEDEIQPEAPDPEVLVAVAQSLVAAGDRVEARVHFLAAAAAYRASGRLAAALDACLPVIALNPADPDVHLLLAEIYVDHGWRAPAADKLRLLGRLAELTGDSETKRLAADLAVARLGQDLRAASPPG